MKKILVLMAVLTIPSLISAQSKLDNLVFEKPDCLIKPKGENCNIRLSPNPKSKIVAKLYSETEGVAGAKNHNAQWYKLPNGYVSKSAVKVIKPTAITNRMMLPTYYCDQVDVEETVSWGLCDDVGSHHLALYYINSGLLYLGKRIGDIVVLKYMIRFGIEKDNTAPKTCKVKHFSQDDILFTTMVLGSAFFNKNGTETSNDDDVLDINFKLFNDKIIEKLFGEVIDEGPNINECLTGDNFPEEIRIEATK